MRLQTQRSEHYSPTVEGSIHVRGNFLLNLFCSNAILTELPEWSILGKTRMSQPSQISMIQLFVISRSVSVNSSHGYLWFNCSLSLAQSVWTALTDIYDSIVCYLSLSQCEQLSRISMIQLFVISRSVSVNSSHGYLWFNCSLSLAQSVWTALTDIYDSIVCYLSLSQCEQLSRISMIQLFVISRSVSVNSSHGYLWFNCSLSLAQSVWTALTDIYDSIVHYLSLSQCEQPSRISMIQLFTISRSVSVNSSHGYLWFNCLLSLAQSVWTALTDIYDSIVCYLSLSQCEQLSRISMIQLFVISRSVSVNSSHGYLWFNCLLSLAQSVWTALTDIYDSIVCYLSLSQCEQLSRISMIQLFVISRSVSVNSSHGYLWFNCSLSIAQSVWTALTDIYDSIVHYLSLSQCEQPSQISMIQLFTISCSMLLYFSCK